MDNIRAILVRIVSVDAVLLVMFVFVLMLLTLNAVSSLKV